MMTGNRMFHTRDIEDGAFTDPAATRLPERGGEAAVETPARLRRR